ncbi:hypothetical protein RTP6_003762 [Batrachochytrium dendrobatidis]
MITNIQKNRITVGLIVGVCSLAVFTVASPISRTAKHRKCLQQQPKDNRPSQSSTVKD